jgi:hypothetical protein
MTSLGVRSGTKTTSWDVLPARRRAASLSLSRPGRSVARPAIDHPRDFTVSLGPLRRAACGRGIRFVLRRLRLEKFPVHLPDILPGRLLGFRSAANDGGSEAKHRKQPQRSDELRVFHWSFALDRFSTAVQYSSATHREVYLG